MYICLGLGCVDLERPPLRTAPSVMALKGPKVRARVGEKRAPGEVRPVTNRTLIGVGAGVIAAVVLATAAILWASAGTKTRVDNVSSNTPHGVPTSDIATYSEVADLPALLRNAPAKSDPASQETVTSTISLQCSSSCTSGNYSGFGGKFALSVSGSNLTGTLNSACQNDNLVLTAPTAIAAPAKLPQTFTGTLTRTSTCPGTDVASPVKLQLRVP